MQNNCATACEQPAEAALSNEIDSSRVDEISQAATLAKGDRCLPVQSKILSTQKRS